MRKIALLSLVLTVAFAVALTAQPPAGGGGGGRGGGGGQGGGRGGGRGAGAAAAPAPLQAFADSLAAAINKQDAAALTKMTAMDAIYLDEDGHAPSIASWIANLTKAGKTFTINMSHGQMLDDNSAWVSFNWTLAETFQNAPKTISGTASLALKKVGADWQIAMVHGALKQSVAGMTQ
jgi:hypothetical protein